MDQVESPVPEATLRTASPLNSSTRSSLRESPDQQFCLKWNNYQANLTSVFDQLLQSESFVDVTLTTDEGHSLKCHKVVLSACSPYFQKLFEDNPCQHPIVILKDMDRHDLKCVVEYMYKGEVNVTQNQLGSILRAAETLKVRGLNEMVRSPSDDVVLEEPRDLRPHKKRRLSPDMLECVPRGLLKTRNDLFENQLARFVLCLHCHSVFALFTILSP
jgi:hypothetical protein